LRRTECESHRAFSDPLTVHARDALQPPHAASQPDDDRFDLDDIAGPDRAAIADALDAAEEDQALTVFGFRENHDGADLGDGLGEDGRRQHR
jgi:hypothetical protein